jgi:hypothetical protein
MTAYSILAHHNTQTDEQREVWYTTKFVHDSWTVLLQVKWREECKSVKSKVTKIVKSARTYEMEKKENTAIT